MASKEPIHSHDSDNRRARACHRPCLCKAVCHHAFRQGTDYGVCQLLFEQRDLSAGLLQSGTGGDHALLCHLVLRFAQQCLPIGFLRLAHGLFCCFNIFAPGSFAHEAERLFGLA